MIAGAPPRSATDAFMDTLERAKRLTALQVNTLARAVVDPDDVVGWTRLTTLGTATTVRAQDTAKLAVSDYLGATLDAAGAFDTAPVSVPVQSGVLASGRDVQGAYAATEGVVKNRMAGGMNFIDALDASARFLTSLAASEPARVGRDGVLAAAAADYRFERFRRVAVGATCDFCLMLATRGAVYLTRESAGEARKYHFRCDCRIEAVVGEGIARSTSLQSDWRNAIRDPERLRAAGVRTEWANLSDDVVARAAAEGSREAAAELAARQAFDAVNPSGVAADAQAMAWQRGESGVPLERKTLTRIAPERPPVEDFAKWRYSPEQVTEEIERLRGNAYGYERQLERYRADLERGKADLATEKGYLKSAGVKPQAYRSHYGYKSQSDYIKRVSEEIDDLEVKLGQVIDDADFLERTGLTRGQYEAAERAWKDAAKHVEYRDGLGAIVVDENYTSAAVSFHSVEEATTIVQQNLYDALDALPQNVREHVLRRGYTVAVNADAQGIDAAAFTYAGQSFRDGTTFWASANPRWTGVRASRIPHTKMVSDSGYLVEFPGVAEGAETFIHEIGHMVDVLTQDDVGRLFERVMAVVGDDKVLLSGYGRTKDREMVAETFVRWVRGDTDEVVQMVAEAQRWAAL